MITYYNIVLNLSNHFIAIDYVSFYRKPILGFVRLLIVEKTCYLFSSYISPRVRCSLGQCDINGLLVRRNVKGLIKILNAYVPIY